MYTMPPPSTSSRFGITVGTDLGDDLGALGNGIKYSGDLACLGIFAENPKAAKHSRLGQVTPSHAKSRVIFLM
jgi:hypothetical protein